MAAATALTRLGRIDNHVAQLARSAVGARKHLAIEYDACADTGTERYEHEAAVACTGALPQLSHGRCVGVVEEAHVCTREGGLQRIMHTQQVEAQIGGDGDVAVGRNRAGNRKADALEQGCIDAGIFEHRRNAIRNSRIAGFVHQRRSGDARLSNDVTFLCHNADLNRSAAHIDADIEFIYHVLSLPREHSSPVIIAMPG